MNIVFALYEGMTALDMVGPYQVFATLPNAKVTLAASSGGLKRTDTGLQVQAELALHDVRDADVIVVPGTSRPDLPIADKVLIEWLASASKRAQWTTSVCTGALVLGAAGLLRGKRATTHWLLHAALREYGAEPVHERVVFDGALVTAAGVSAGIDMALAVAARLQGEELAKAIQLILEYDPQPPFAAGSPASAGPKVVELATRMAMEAMPNVNLAR